MTQVNQHGLQILAEVIQKILDEMGLDRLHEMQIELKPTHAVLLKKLTLALLEENGIEEGVQVIHELLSTKEPNHRRWLNHVVKEVTTKKLRRLIKTHLQKRGRSV